MVGAEYCSRPAWSISSMGREPGARGFEWLRWKLQQTQLRETAGPSRYRDHRARSRGDRGRTGVAGDAHGAERLPARRQHRDAGGYVLRIRHVANLPEGATGFTTIELKSNHLGTAREGTIVSRATAVHLGKTTHVGTRSYAQGIRQDDCAVSLHPVDSLPEGNLIVRRRGPMRCWTGLSGG